MKRLLINVLSSGFLFLIFGCSGGTSNSEPPAVVEPSDNALLQTLKFSAGSLSPTFDPSVTDYELTLGYSNATLTTYATTQDSKAQVKIGNASALLNEAVIHQAISIGQNNFSVLVTAENNSTTTEYRFIVNRAPMSDFVQQSYIKKNNPIESYDLFGTSLAVSKNRLAIGAYNDFSATGAVYVYRMINNSWQLEGVVRAAYPSRNDGFGGSIALQGDTLVVGAVGESSSASGVNGNQDDDSSSSSGAAYVFEYSNGSWQQTFYLKASNPDDFDYFGADVALDQDTIAVGAINESSDARGVNGNQNNNDAPASGAIYVFKRSNNNWIQQSYIKASNSDSRDQFGGELALKGDTLVAGSSLEWGDGSDPSDNSAKYTGAVYVYSRSNDQWNETAYLKASNPDSSDGFGSSVALGNGVLAIGAKRESSISSGVNGDQTDNTNINSGAVYIFTLESGTWTQQAYIKSSNPDWNDYFGERIAFEGNLLAVSATGESSNTRYINGDEMDNSSENAGAVYLFNLVNGDWNQIAYIKASNTDADDKFGKDVVIVDGRLFISANYEQSNAQGINGNQQDNSIDGAGAVYVFESN